ncbi:isoprenylcysteine carboxylmethyltransferase family protein [bacterium]|nr:MAG: isoprenylcysteine carboxylmethyltransferase family protein [bacterium]
MTETQSQKLGFKNKPLVEQLKLVALFALIAALVYFSRPTTTLFAAGAVATLIGILVRVWAAGHLTRDQRLAVSGPYAHTRNPFYLGRLFVLVGFALMSGLQNLFVWAIFALGIGFFFFGYMPRKERREGGRLEQLFGDQFRQYRKNVPSLFPRPTAYRDPFTTEKRPWNRELFFGGDGNFSGNKELPTALATLLLIALFFARLVTLNP